MELDSHGRRRHVRHTVYEPCRVVVEDLKYQGTVVDMSVGGAAIQVDVHLEMQPAADTPFALHIEGIGRIPAQVVRPLIDGIAVEFRIDRDNREHLVAALERVIDDYRVLDDHPFEDG